MNRTRTTWQARSLRAVALFLALVCLGISGGTTLVHTEDLGSVRSFHAGRSALGHAVPDAGADTCLACQWEASAFDPQLPAVPIARPHCVLMPLLTARFETAALLPFVHTSPRAPPCALS